MHGRIFQPLASVFALLLVWLSLRSIVVTQAPQAPDSRATAAADGFVGAAKCAECHADMHRTWRTARHSKMLQPASAATVVGDFSQANVTLRGARFTLERDGDRFTIGGRFPFARDEIHRVDFTLGSRRVQHYLTRLADGRIVVLPPSWDVEKREWFHNQDIVDPNEASRIVVQVWNKDCFGCHVSGEEKRYDPARRSYDTRWTDFGTGCERCHGPGAAHAARYAAATPASGSAAIVVPTRLSPERSTMVCAQCHSLRDITVPGFTAGADYFDYFTPVLEYGQKSDKDPAYWPDGRPRRFSNDAIGFWQSRCFLEGGAACTTCHVDPHQPDVDRNPQLGRTNDALCAKCHEPIATLASRHTHHEAGSAGSSCIACHMPRTVISLRSRMPDHTLGVPAPENTVRHQIPNACSECHRDRSAAWAVSALRAWYPNGRRERLVARADAFSAARRRDGAAVDALAAIARDPRQPPLVRTNAIGYLRLFPGAPAEAALRESAFADHPAMRTAALLGLSEIAGANATPVLARAVSDPQQIVRVAAAVGLMNRQITKLDGEAGVHLEAAKRAYVARASLLTDDAGVLLDAGRFHLLNHDVLAASEALESSLRLDGTMHASRYLLAFARVAQGRTAEARDLLLKIPAGDAFAADAAKLLATLPAAKR